MHRTLAHDSAPSLCPQTKKGRAGQQPYRVRRASTGSGQFGNLCTPQNRKEARKGFVCLTDKAKGNWHSLTHARACKSIWVKQQLGRRDQPVVGPRPSSHWQSITTENSTLQDTYTDVSNACRHSQRGKRQQDLVTIAGQTALHPQQHDTQAVQYLVSVVLQ